MTRASSAGAMNAKVEEPLPIRRVKYEAYSWTPIGQINADVNSHTTLNAVYIDTSMPKTFASEINPAAIKWNNGG